MILDHTARYESLMAEAHRLTALEFRLSERDASATPVLSAEMLAFLRRWALARGPDGGCDRLDLVLFIGTYLARSALRMALDDARADFGLEPLPDPIGPGERFESAESLCRRLAIKVDPLVAALEGNTVTVKWVGGVPLMNSLDVERLVAAKFPPAPAGVAQHPLTTGKGPNP